MQQPVFGIKHYAGDVTYQIDGFLEKNRDTLRQDLQDLFKDCEHELVKQWFSDELLPDLSSSQSGNRSSSATSSVRSSMSVSSATKKSAKALTTGYQFHVCQRSFIEVKQNKLKFNCLH